MASSEKTRLYLPVEIVVRIASHVPASQEWQPTLASMALVCRTWFHAILEQLYRSPHITGKNFDLFVRTVCPSINSRVKKSDLAGMVKVLKMDKLVHNGSNSLTARLLSRMKPSLRAFVAPRTTFSLHSYASLAKCNNLVLLDLSLITAYIQVDELCHSLGHLHNLRELRLSRCDASLRQLDDGSTRLKFRGSRSLSLSDNSRSNGPGHSLRQAGDESASPMFPGLRSLSLSGNSTDAALAWYSQLKQVENLEVVNLRLAPALFWRFCLYACPNAKRVSIGAESCSQDGPFLMEQDIPVLLQRRGLEYLFISDQQVLFYLHNLFTPSMAHDRSLYSQWDVLCLRALVLEYSSSDADPQWWMELGLNSTVDWIFESFKRTDDSQFRHFHVLMPETLVTDGVLAVDNKLIELSELFEEAEAKDLEAGIEPCPWGAAAWLTIIDNQSQ